MHKENYFTADSIAAVATAMVRDLPTNRRTAVFSMDNSALLVIDMQRYFLCPGSHAFLPAAPAIIPNINILIAAFKKAARPVYFTRHVNNAQDAGQMAVWWKELLTRDHPLADLDAALNFNGQPVIEKNQYDAFFNTDFEAHLRRNSTKQLVITGLATHLCCESTARAAFTRGFSVFIAADGTATWNRELHFSSLRGLAHGCAIPLLTGELIAATQEPL
jgi:bifunctional isochorismate lyase/aryl carrier protein